MYERFLGCVVAAIFFAAFGAGAPARAADTYAVDPAHAGITFKVSHFGISWIPGRFNGFSGNFTIDPDDASRCSFAMTINAESVDTNNPARDKHLRTPDFFNVKQFPAVTFKSTAVKAIKNGYEVTGDLTLHGVTKPVKLELVGGGKAQFPPGVQRTGYSADFIVKRSEFGIDKFEKMLGEDVYVSVSFEGVKK
jgi:polyisoprenoid-binding protein YceI